MKAEIVIARDLRPCFDLILAHFAIISRLGQYDIDNILPILPP